MITRISGARSALITLAALLASGTAFGAANIVIVNANAPGVGFNDSTPAAPVGGNTGTTLGEQRLNAFAYAASLWGAELDSTVATEVLSTFEPLSCSATSAVLGSAGARWLSRDFAGAPIPGSWFGGALSNKIVGYDEFPADATDGGEEIRARFNSNLGQSGCLPGSPFYLGLDNNPPPGQINLVVVLLHEFAHGLGFQTYTSGLSGEQFLGYPSVWDHYLFDDTTGKTWVEMSDAERFASARNPRQLVWTGGNVTAAAPSVLVPGTPLLTVLAPSGVAGAYPVGTASFGPLLTAPGLTKQMMALIDAEGYLELACNPLSEDNQRRSKNRIAIVLRGTCAFTVKVRNAQDAGAVGVIVIDNVAGGPPAGLGGADPTITIPSARITLADGIALLGGLRFPPSDRSSGLVARLGVDTSVLAGADAAGRVLMYTPSPYQAGSSVSHWDTSAFRNLLMEPAINGDLTQSVKPPEDLTLPLFHDIGW
jgi:hypothetical protein